MPFKESSIMSQKKEFVRLASGDKANVRELCRRFGISPTTGYKLLNRYRDEGDKGLESRSRRPLHSPMKTASRLEELVLKVREERKWGARKIKHDLERERVKGVPAVSTVNAILRRNNCISLEDSVKHKAWQRFECAKPNDHWQMDYKGHFQIGDGRCHPFDVLDDHSRYLLGLEACSNERGETVKERLVKIFRRYGLPDAMVVDNGPPWGGCDAGNYTALAVWIFTLGIRLINIRAWHPETNGKIERMHRSLKSEVLQHRFFKDLDECQEAFDEWRHVYNYRRPHQAIEMKVPADRYEMSKRNYSEKFPELEYGPDDKVRRVRAGGVITFRGRVVRIGGAFLGLPVAVRPTEKDGEYEVFFSRQYIISINLSLPPGGEGKD